MACARMAAARNGAAIWSAVADRQFCQPININFEHKTLFSGNLGPSTGEMGTAMF